MVWEGGGWRASAGRKLKAAYRRAAKVTGRGVMAGGSDRGGAVVKETRKREIASSSSEEERGETNKNRGEGAR